MDKKYIAHSDDLDFEEKVEDLLLYRRIIYITKVDEQTAILTLDNGVELITIGNEGCGGEAVVYSGHLKSGHTQSCGCLISKGEEKIAKILSENNIPFIKQYCFADCRGINNGMLRFDFAVFNSQGLSHLIEYDGWQHYYNAGAKWDKDGRFETRQEHDKIKNEYCKKNNIPLIRITSKDYSNIKISDLILKGE